ncbi:MAG: DEAD/DEAH box helicase [Candidatus Aenigmarchaeota archaeon]|nr:DEAD/DEAH box helicase [Candidatus Aenigmarchaeota archaeon]
MKFSEMGILPEIEKALSHMGIEEPTDIQEKAMPPIIRGEDVIVISKTGSGKTLAFGVPILGRVQHGGGVQALVVAPTRELVVQIAGELSKFGKGTHLRVEAIYGGVSINPQIMGLRGCDVVVGTPGRLVDHLQRNTLNLSRAKAIVLDEADRMMEMGFIEDIERILQASPTERQTVLLGATISDQIMRVKERYMRSPRTVRSVAHVEKEYLDQYYYDVQPDEKFSILVHLLQKEENKKGLIMIFSATRRGSDALARNLHRQGFNAEAIHGGHSQDRRLNVMSGFREGKSTILVATGVAARGLDIKGVELIINYELSADPEEYIHRVGRTARAGSTGKAITLLSFRDYDTFRDITHRFPIEVQKLEKEPFKRVPYDSGRRDSFDSGRGGGRGRFGNYRSGHNMAGRGSHAGGGRWGGGGRKKFPPRRDWR